MGREGPKVGSLKHRGAESPGQMRHEKLHAAVVTRSAFSSQHVKNGTSLWREARFQVNCSKKHESLRPLLEVRMLKNCTLLWCEARFTPKILKPWSFGPFLEG